MTHKHYRIVAIVPTYNSFATLKKCISSLQKQDYKFFKIIVVDNNSSDETYLKTKKKFPDVNIIKLSRNMGVTGGRNAGIKQAGISYDYLFFFDHDMVGNKRMLQELLKAVSIYGEGIFTPKIYYFSDKKKIWAAGTGINLYTGQILFRGGYDKGQFEHMQPVEVAPAAMLVSKQVIQNIRKFDPKYFATYEDTDFCFRAKKAGFNTIYVPRAVAYHDLTTDPLLEAKRLLSRLYWVGRNRVLFMKDFGKPIWWLFLPIFLVYYLRLSLKYGSINDYWQFLLGTYDGILNKR